MIKVAVGSKNPMKLEAVKEAFSLMFKGQEFEFLTCSASSSVSDQPFGNDETKLGATNRSNDCRRLIPEADYFVGLEGGVEITGGEFWAFAWMCVQDKEGKRGFGRAASFKLPNKVKDLIEKGEELGHATDIVFNQNNSKHKNSIVRILTNNVITRKDFYREAMVFALIPFLNSELY